MRSPYPTLNAGELRHQIVILHQVAGSDESGSAVSMQPLVTTYGKIEITHGNDIIRNGQVVTETFLVVSIWYQAGIEANMQVQANGNTYIIEEMENVLEMNIVLKLNCIALGRNE